MDDAQMPEITMLLNLSAILTIFYLPLQLWYEKVTRFQVIQKKNWLMDTHVDFALENII